MIRLKLNARSKAELDRVVNKKIADLSSKKTKKDAGKEGLKPIERIAKNRVEVKTGRLRDSIRIEEKDDGAELLTDVEYAASEEYLGRPYMRPAAQEGSREAILRASEVFKKEAEKR